MNQPADPSSILPFDWRRLKREFQQATTLPGVVAGQPDWWDRWHHHLAERSTPKWFYSKADAPTFFRSNWPTWSMPMSFGPVACQMATSIGAPTPRAA